MHNLASMLADLEEAVEDMAESAVIVHVGGVQSVIPSCAFSDLGEDSRMIEEEGVIESVDAEMTYAAKYATKAAKRGDRVLRGNAVFRVQRVRMSRGNVSVTLSLKEVR